MGTYLSATPIVSLETVTVRVRAEFDEIGQS